VKNITRKIDIASHSYRKAARFLRENGVDPREVMADEEEEEKRDN
jgi:hypothetical protein